MPLCCSALRGWTIERRRPCQHRRRREGHMRGRHSLSHSRVRQRDPFPYTTYLRSSRRTTSRAQALPLCPAWIRVISRCRGQGAFGLTARANTVVGSAAATTVRVGLFGKTNLRRASLRLACCSHHSRIILRIILPVIAKRSRKRYAMRCAVA